MGWRVQPRFDRTSSRWYLRVGGRKVYSRTEAAAWAVYAKRLTQPATGCPEAVAEGVAAWCERRGRWRADLIKPFAVWAGFRRLGSLGPDALETYLREQLVGRYAPRTIRHALRIAAEFCRWCVDRGWLPSAPRMPRPPAAPIGERDIPADQLKALIAYIEAAKRRSHAARLLRFCLFTGCRPGEARRLRWEQLRWSEGSHGLAVVPEHKSSRTGRPRIIMLTAEARELLDSMREAIPGADGWVFPSGRGEPYTAAGLRSIVQRAGRAVGVEVTPYRLRHTCAQGWVDQGAPIDVVARLLGHADLKTVQVYAQVRDRRLNEVAADLVPKQANAPGVFAWPAAGRVSARSIRLAPSSGRHRVFVLCTTHCHLAFFGFVGRG